MSGLFAVAVRLLRDRWPLLTGTLGAIALGVALVHSGLTIATTVAAATPPAGLDPADRAAFLARLNGTNTLNGIALLLGLFLTIFVVRSTIDFSVTERRREFALLRLAGVTRRQARSIVLVEALILAGIGALLGSLLGLLIAAGQRSIYVHMDVMPADVTLRWQPAHLMMDAVVAVVVALAGARTSSKRAMRISPLDALHQRGDHDRPMTRARWLWGTTTAAATVAQLSFAAWIGGFLAPLLLGLGSIITGSIAASQLAPLLVPLTARAVLPVARGPLPQLAMAKLVNDARRAAQVAAPLIVLVGLVGGLQGLLDTQAKAGEIEIAATTRADLILTSRGDPTGQVGAIHGVASAGVEFQVPATITIQQGETTTDLPGSVIAVDTTRLAVIHPYRVRSGNLAAFDDQHVVFGPGTEDGQLARPIEDIVLTVGSERHHLDEAARTGEGLAASDGIYVSRTLIPDRVLQESPTRTLIRLTRGSDFAKVRAAVDALHIGATITPAEEATQRNATTVDENRGVMTALVGVGSLYALINLLSVVAISITGRRSELAIDRLTGLTRRQTLRVVLLETTVTVAIGILLGSLVSIVALSGLWLGTWREYGTPVIAIPWALLSTMTLLVATLTSLTAAAATSRATARLPIRELTTKE